MALRIRTSSRACGLAERRRTGSPGWTCLNAFPEAKLRSPYHRAPIPTDVSCAAAGLARDLELTMRPGLRKAGSRERGRGEIGPCHAAQ